MFVAGRVGTVVEANASQQESPAAPQPLEQQLNAKDWLLTQLQVADVLTVDCCEVNREGA